jgi:hypothetical protein
MAATTLSQSGSLFAAAVTLSLVPIGLGITALIKPRAILGLVEFPVPAAPENMKLVYNLLRMYGVRNIVMGSALCIVAYSGRRDVFGCLLIVSSLVGFVDGFVAINQTGKGQWSHWGFMPVMIGMGSALLGVFD